MKDLEQKERLLNKIIGIKYALQNEYNEKKQLKDVSEQKLKLLEKAQVFLQAVAQETQSKLKIQIEDIVNLALDTVFPNEYNFELQFNIARGKTEASLVFTSQKTGREIDPINASGGGVVDIVSFALRLAVFVIEEGIDNVIILDEPFKFLSKDLIERACLILKNLSEKLNLQMIIVTHIPELVEVAERVFEVKKNNDGRSLVRIIN